MNGLFYVWVHYKDLTFCHLFQGDEESNIGNPVPQEQPPPYQPQPQNYGTGGEPVPPAYEAG